MLGKHFAVAVSLPMATNPLPASQDRARIADESRLSQCNAGCHQRILHAFIGLALIAYVTPVFFRVPLRFTVEVFLLLLGLIALFSLLHIASRRIVAFGSSLGAVVATGLLVALYVAGTHGSLIFGHGEGALAVITFLGVSLVV